jgi:signal transduction histidine kinase
VERLLPTYPPSPESNNSFSTATNFSAKNFTTQQSFSDTALTAFAQLIAIRLASQRAIVSLIDHENEYFLAESTSTLSLTDNGGLEQNAWLSISGARVPLRESLCEETLKLVPNQDPMIEQTPWYLVPDLQLDERMKNLSCVKQSPHLRFYCGVALANKKGINIGCVYVVDNRPRTDFTLEQAQFLTSMTATIMDHLECIRAKEDIVRVTMMSQALHAFIEGDATMDGDWQRLKRYDLPGGAGVGFSWETKKNDGSGVYANGKKQLGSSCRSTHSRSSSDASRQQSPLQHAGTTQDARFNFNNSPWSSSEEDVKIPVLKSVLQGAEPPNAVLETSEGGRDAEFSNDGFSTLLHLTFSRASNLTREGMEIDGAVFFDAPFRFYQGRSTLQTDTRRSATADSEDVSDEESIADHEEHHDARPGPYPLVQPPNKHAEPTGAMQDSMGLKAEVLGFSTSTSSSLKNQAISPETFSSIDQSLLTALVRRYPKGQLFEFDEQGPISTNEDLQFNSSQTTIVSRDVEVKQIRDRARKRSEILRLLASFPRARHIAFVPLYDSTSGCFIGSFAWSTSATRLFSVDNHLSYLVAFGHSVMSEVGRLNTLSADRAKGDFISNVSHELRSPLHGILASVEFLADTQLDGFQRNLVDTVDICGRTLLDTIEHVLDFSKIKSFGQESSQPLGVVADLDVSAVIEEVLEGVYAGFEFNGLSSQGLADNTRSGVHSFRPSTGTFSTSSSSPTPDQKVIVILDVDFRDQWKFPTAPGTWKRLTMNVFGNALKYTHHGYIKVKVEARPMSALTTTSSILERTMITLTISDSGRGMSSEFMKSKLFMPFSQVWVLFSKTNSLGR